MPMLRLWAVQSIACASKLPKHAALHMQTMADRVVALRWVVFDLMNELTESLW